MSLPRTVVISALFSVSFAVGFGRSSLIPAAHANAAAGLSGGTNQSRAGLVGPNNAQQPKGIFLTRDGLQVSVQYFSTDGTSLSQLSTGGSGDGWLVYYLSDSGVLKPSLVVHLVKIRGAATASAEVFGAPTGSTFVPFQVTREQVRLDSSLQPAITMTSKDGWWVRNGQVSYNLDIRVNGPVYAMWGGAYDPQSGATGWASQVQRDEATVDIQVRDPEHSGIPAWDLRTLLPKFAGQAYDRTNYAERKCNTPTTIDLGPSPLWPYVAARGGFEQVAGKLQPPIVVDWETGQITHFSELVTVRNQNCSYSLYSLDPLKLGQINQPDFETPFAFYDLSGQGVGYPNLILRTERYPVGDTWAIGMDPSLTGPLATDLETVRYSWRDAVGDQRMDYKVETLGFYPYGYHTPIADGLATIDAPPYAQFPQWVVGRTWPIVTFVDPEAVNYVSSEGIYEWSPRQAGLGYALGRQDSAAPQAFTQIPAGLRGEYRLDHNLQPWLYFSPLDNRLHLLGADGGLWNLGNGQQIRASNLDNGQYINSWVREEVLTGQVSQIGAAPSASTIRVLEALYALPGYILYSGPQGVVLRRADYTPASFTILPPTDHTTWLAFNAKVEPLRSSKRDPNNLASWLDGAPGQDQTLAGASVQDVRITTNGFRFVLDVWPGYQAKGSQVSQFVGLRPGQYLVEYSGAFAVQPLRQGQPEFQAGTLKVSMTNPLVLEPVRVEAVLGNAGSADRSTLTVRLVATGPQSTTQVITTEVGLLAGQPVPVHFDWTPTVAGEWRIQLSVGEAGAANSSNGLGLAELNLLVQPQPLPGIDRLWQLSNISYPWAVVLVLSGIALSAAAVVMLMVRRARTDS